MWNLPETRECDFTLQCKCCSENIPALYSRCLTHGSSRSVRYAGREGDTCQQKYFVDSSRVGCRRNREIRCVDGRNAQSGFEGRIDLRLRSSLQLLSWLLFRVGSGTFLSSVPHPLNESDYSNQGRQYHPSDEDYADYPSTQPAFVSTDTHDELKEPTQRGNEYPSPPRNTC
jgi:hypothetical protein